MIGLDSLVNENTVEFLSLRTNATLDHEAIMFHKLDSLRIIQLDAPNISVKAMVNVMNAKNVEQIILVGIDSLSKEQLSAINKLKKMKKLILLYSENKKVVDDARKTLPNVTVIEMFTKATNP